jgi:hypothetical protein
MDCNAVRRATGSKTDCISLAASMAVAPLCIYSYLQSNARLDCRIQGIDPGSGLTQVAEPSRQATDSSYEQVAVDYTLCRSASGLKALSTFCWRRCEPYSTASRWSLAGWWNRKNTVQAPVTDQMTHGTPTNAIRH